MSDKQRRRTVRRIEDLVAEDETRVEEVRSIKADRAGKAEVSDAVGERRKISKSPPHSPAK